MRSQHNRHRRTQKPQPVAQSVAEADSRVPPIPQPTGFVIWCEVHGDDTIPIADEFGRVMTAQYPRNQAEYDQMYSRLQERIAKTGKPIYIIFFKAQALLFTATASGLYTGYKEAREN